MDEKVLLILADGLRPDAMMQCGTPVCQRTFIEKQLYIGRDICISAGHTAGPRFIVSQRYS